MSDSELLDWVQTTADKHGFSGNEGQDGTGVEVSVGDDSVGVKKTPDGTTLTIKKEQDLGVARRNFAIGPIPCYTKGSLKASIEGSLTVGNKTGGALQATGAGSLELGAGYSGNGVTVGPYGAVSLSASHSTSISYSDADGLDVQPYTFAIKGGGKVGIKVELDSGEKLDVEQEVFDWELFVVNVGRYTNDKFEFIDVRSGKDMDRFLNALSAGGAEIEAFVEEYVPEPIKQAAVKGAEWSIESDEAGEVQEAVQFGVDKIKDETGVDVGAGAEKFMQSLVDPGGETSGEATARFQKQDADYDTRLADFKAVLKASGISGELKEFVEEGAYDKVWTLWQKETEVAIQGQSSPETWKALLVEIIKKARALQAQKKAWLKQKAAQEDESVKQAMNYMEGARTAALGSGNVLNNKLKQTPNAEAKAFFDKGWQPWAAAEQTRNKVASLQGPDKAQMASRAASQYEEALQHYRTGLQYLN